jgi:hypothetical protein
MSGYVNSPVCEACWVAREATWDENPDMDILIGLRLPVRIIEPELEQCGICGAPTFIGVYQRLPRSEAPHFVDPPEDES